MFSPPDFNSKDDYELLRAMGAPESRAVSRSNGGPLEPGMPRYIVRPADDLSMTLDSVKIIDYGESFFDSDPPKTLHTPLAVRAPEVLVGAEITKSVDLWGMGCLVHYATLL